MTKDTNTTFAADETPPKKGLELSTKILIGLGAGIACGLFFGEEVAWLKGAGHVFVGLLQMTVLPYLMVALIANLGRLDIRSSRKLLTSGALVMVGLWALACAAILLTPLSLPTMETGSFFSAGQADDAQSVGLLSLFVPFNVFESLSSSMVPAVVVFCIFFGLALMTLERKQKLIEMFDVMSEALLRVNGMVVKLMPWGTFAIAGGAAGTLSFEEFSRLEGYLLASVATVAILTFWVVPMLIAAVTPFRYGQILKAAGTALITAFATSKVIVVLPLLIDETNRLFREAGAAREETEPTIEVLYPLAYAFPHMGKLMGMIFIPFAAWFVGSPLDVTDMPVMLGAGVLSYFGGPLLATPFLLDFTQTPADMFQLFLAGGVFTARLGDLLGVMHFMAFAIITTCALTGRLRISVPGIAKALSGGALLAIVAIFAIHARLEASLANAPDRSQVLAEMQNLDRRVEQVVREAPAPNPIALRDGQSILERMRQSGVLRVGFNPARLPFCYFNGKGELVGLDVELMDTLAQDLGVRLEFVPYEFASLEEQLAQDHFDLAIGGIVATATRLEHMRVTAPYLEAHICVIVRDHERDDYVNMDTVSRLNDVRVGFVDPLYERGLRLALPSATPVRIQSAQEFFDGKHPTLNALADSAEVGYAWTLQYPHFHVALLLGEKITRPQVFPVSSEDAGFRDFLDGWIGLTTRDGTLTRLYDYWVLGKSVGAKEPRWSVIRDVLGWVD